MSRSLWNCLHDGIIIAVHKDTPDDLIVSVKIDYLRNLFEGEGLFDIRLKNCNQFEFFPWEEGTDSVTGQKLAALQLWVLSVSDDDLGKDALKIHCGGGNLLTSYTDFDLLLDGKLLIPFEQLDAKSQEYWKNFGTT